jgi:hypothetical protein
MMRRVVILNTLIGSVVRVIVAGSPSGVWVLLEEWHFESSLLRREVRCVVHFKSLKFQIYIHSYE